MDSIKLKGTKPKDILPYENDLLRAIYELTGTPDNLWKQKFEKYFHANINTKKNEAKVRGDAIEVIINNTDEPEYVRDYLEKDIIAANKEYDDVKLQESHQEDVREAEELRKKKGADDLKRKWGVK